MCLAGAKFKDASHVCWGVVCVLCICQCELNMSSRLE